MTADEIDRLHLEALIVVKAYLRQPSTNQEHMRTVQKASAVLTSLAWKRDSKILREAVDELRKLPKIDLEAHLEQQAKD